MAIVFAANYSKKLGLPGYSSHQYSVTIRTELADLNQVSEHSEQVHALLQSAVDREIQKTGYLPSPQPEQAQTNGATNGNRNGGTNGYHRNQQHNGYRNGHSRYNNGQREPWKCSPKQQQLIERMVQENNMDKQEIEKLAVDLFGVGVTKLNKLQASGLIDELLQQANQTAGGRQ